jgi:hypothetical protein
MPTPKAKLSKFQRSDIVATKRKKTVAAKPTTSTVAALSGTRPTVEAPDGELRVRLEKFGVREVFAKSMLASAFANEHLVRGWKVALDRADRRGLDATLKAWMQRRFRRLATEEATDETRALAAEIDAALRLSWIASVARIKETKHPTCDLRVGDFNVEVYCPQQHREERRVVDADLAEELSKVAGPFKVAAVISYPNIGSGRRVGDDGRVVRDAHNNALRFPANKLGDRILRKKRDGKQFREGDRNILWLDLKHGVASSTVDCIPLRSIIAKGTCFVGMTGVWDAFYGQKGDPLFAERTTLEYPIRPGTYSQNRDGWFRQSPQVSCVLVSVLDGLVRLDNPWAAVRIDQPASALMMTLSEIRPEFSWFDDEARTLEFRVEAERRRIDWLAQRRGENAPL